MYQAYAADPQMRINVGIRRRLAPLLENSRRRIELLQRLLFSMPGTPVIYYGDEIGMGDNIYLGDRNGVRTPMQWTGDRNAGFSRADPARLFAPPVMDPVYGYQAINVEAQERAPFSLLNWMKRMIGLRKQFQVFGRGTIEFLPAENRKILAYVRRYKDDEILCVANLSRSVQPVELDLSALQGPDAGRDAGPDRVPDDRRAAVLPDAARVLLLLVPAAAVALADQRARAARGGAGAGGAGALHGRRVGHAARRQRPDVDRARSPDPVPAAAALVRRQGAPGPLGAIHRLGRAAARRRSRCSSPSSRSTTRMASATAISCRWRFARPPTRAASKSVRRNAVLARVTGARKGVLFDAWLDNGFGRALLEMFEQQAGRPLAARRAACRCRPADFARCPRRRPARRRPDVRRAEQHVPRVRRPTDPQAVPTPAARHQPRLRDRPSADRARRLSARDRRLPAPWNTGRPAEQPMTVAHAAAAGREPGRRLAPCDRRGQPVLRSGRRQHSAAGCGAGRSRM